MCLRRFGRHTQAASCQRVLKGVANIALEYATKRYRSNLINWGIIPFLADYQTIDEIKPDDYIYIKDIKPAIENRDMEIKAKLISNGSIKKISLFLPGISEDESEILLSGCLINYYRGGHSV